MSSSTGVGITPPPPGITPNFAHPQSIAYRTNITAGVCLGTLWTFYAVRVYASLAGISKQNKWWKELNLALAVVLTTVYISICVVDDSYFGIYGVHEWDIQLQNFEVKIPLVISVAVEVLYPVIMFWIKFCLLILYLDVFGRLTWFRWSCYIQIVVLGLFSISAMIAFGLMCSPDAGSRNWFGYLMAFASAKCKRAGTLTIFQGAFNLTSDLVLLVLPLPAIWSLNMPIRKKLGISVMFLTGVCAVVTSSLGVYYRVLISRGWGDVSWWSVPTQATGIAEMTAGIVILCMPAVAAVLRRVKRPSFRSYISSALRSRSPSRSWRRVLYGSDKSTGVSGSTSASSANRSFNRSQHGVAEEAHNYCCAHGVNHPNCDKTFFNTTTTTTVTSNNSSEKLTDTWTSGPAVPSKMPARPADAFIQKKMAYSVVHEDR